MGPRAPLALWIFAALALAGCDAGGSYPNSDGGPGADMGIHFATDLAKVDCDVVTISAVDATTGLPKTRVPARLIASVPTSGATDAQWTVMRTGDSMSYVPQMLDPSNLRVQFDATQAGTWTFVVHFPSRGCTAMNSTTLDQGGATVLYRFRVLPPETSGFPLTDVTVSITGGTPLSRDLTLDAGTAVSGVLRAAGVATVGEVRLIADPDSGPDADAITDGSGNFALAVQASGYYTPLLIPQSPTLAPHLGARAQGATFLGASFDVTGGATVTGTVVDGAATAIGGARVVLRAGALPSGTGTTSGAGAFTLHAEPTTYTMSFGTDAWPQGSIGGVVVPAGGASVAIAYTIGRVAVGGSVVADDGTTAIAGARVTIVSRPLGNLANVTVGGGAAMPATGRVARVVTTDALGALPAMQLPLGTYDLIVEPPGPSLDGLTAVTEVLAGAATWTLKLDKPVALSGTVTDTAGHGVAGARITAVETVGLGAAPSTLTDANGHYSLFVDKGAPLQLLVEPAAADKLAGARVSLAANAGTADVALGPGLEVSGVVRSPSAAPQPGVRVEALCFACGSTTPLATSISDSQGNYRLYLPDPGDRSSTAARAIRGCRVSSCPSVGRRWSSGRRLPSSCSASSAASPAWRASSRSCRASRSSPARPSSSRAPSSACRASAPSRWCCRTASSSSPSTTCRRGRA